jgi:hypothetical protein
MLRNGSNEEEKKNASFLNNINDFKNIVNNK